MRRGWMRAALAVAALELIVLGGTLLAAVMRPEGHPLDGLAYALLLVAGATVGLAQRWPLPAFVLSLGATTAFQSLGYSSATPMFLGLIATLYAAVAPDQPWRSVAMGSLTVGTLAVKTVFASGLTGLNAGTLAAAGWVVAVLLAGHAIAGHRAYVAATEERAQRAEETRETEAQRRVTEERLRIARELHDVVSQSISMINVQAGVAAHVLDRQPEQARQALLVIKGASKEALRELRGILGVLRAIDDGESTPPAPGLAQLPLLLETARQAGLAVKLTIVGQERSLSPGLELAAYRIVQESLTNALRYAGNASAEVRLTFECARLLVEICDDGSISAGRPAGPGHGIAGMRERATAAGGHLEAGPLPGRGFRVEARFPLPHGAPSA